MPKAKGAREKGTKRGTTWVAGEPASLAEQGVDKHVRENDGDGPRLASSRQWWV
jgi:hypothetical protein